MVNLHKLVSLAICNASEYCTQLDKGASRCHPAKEDQCYQYHVHSYAGMIYTQG